MAASSSGSRASVRLVSGSRAARPSPLDVRRQRNRESMRRARMRQREQKSEMQQQIWRLEAQLATLIAAAEAQHRLPNATKLLRSHKRQLEETLLQSERERLTLFIEILMATKIFTFLGVLFAGPGFALSERIGDLGAAREGQELVAWVQGSRSSVDAPPHPGYRAGCSPSGSHAPQRGPPPFSFGPGMGGFQSKAKRGAALETRRVTCRVLYESAL
ncbi:hypothetical protein PHYPSEUDO_002015 [Phytophthora pseudosyringae]|uniref:BZIP domain-containing protein n=1 Tax=Phytophthora pseudosyringae TaxID=221518 RepID=A0A8T1VYK7_9STRA|nr:hypothetical protein PHYPSEUDO_002015 [Phytophthora pseudosyringae]